MSTAYATVGAGGIDDDAWLLLSRADGMATRGGGGGAPLRPPHPPLTLTSYLADGSDYLSAGGCFGNNGGMPTASVPSSAMPLEHFKARATEVAHQQYDRGPGRKRRLAAAARGYPADPMSEESLKKERKLKSAYVSRYRGTIYVDLLKAAIVAAEADNTARRGSVAVAADTNARLAAQCAQLERELVLLNERWRMACGADPALGGLDARRVVGRKRPKMGDGPPLLSTAAAPPVPLARVPPAGTDASPRSGRFSLGSTVSPAPSPQSRPTVVPETVPPPWTASRPPPPSGVGVTWHLPTTEVAAPAPTAVRGCRSPPLSPALEGSSLSIGTDTGLLGSADDGLLLDSAFDDSVFVDNATVPTAVHATTPPSGGSASDSAPEAASNFPMMCNLAAKAISVDGGGNGGGKSGGKAVSAWPEVSFNEWMPAIDDGVCEAAPAA
ncbi:hypothetical protein MMPV_002087 [Pyropia vietnamensis]